MPEPGLPGSTHLTAEVYRGLGWSTRRPSRSSSPRLPGSAEGLPTLRTLRPSGSGRIVLLPQVARAAPRPVVGQATNGAVDVETHTIRQ